MSADRRPIALGVIPAVVPSAGHGGTGVYQIAKNRRTSVEMIEKYSAVHLRTSHDIATITVQRERRYRDNSVSQEVPED